MPQFLHFTQEGSYLPPKPTPLQLHHQRWLPPPPHHQISRTLIYYLYQLHTLLFIIRKYNSSDVKQACDGADIAIVCLGTGNNVYYQHYLVKHAND